MSAIDRRARLGTLIVIVLGSVGCGGSLGGGAGPGGRPGQGSGTAGASGLGGSSGLGGTAASTGTGGAENLGGAFGTGTGGSMCMHSAAGEVPSEHRPMPPSCESNPPIPLVSGGLPACATSADCTSQGYGSCTAGHCVSDFCLADGDCQKGYVCACGGETFTVSPPAGATDAAAEAYAINTCVPATCRMDSDCGPEGYCSPSYTCGTVQGYYCHGPADTCADPAKDCCGSADCFWSATAGAFVCAVELCISE